MDYECPICGKLLPHELIRIISHGEAHITEEIKKKHPEWVESNGVCRKCYEYYREQIRPKDKK
ncbi:MAG: hypothetical protein JSW40_08725 [Candidatus Omnitrophota bacterium]|nr:MAG: hypothetical protein JSW40_08725 [Candidatus Omnitrophota bacterium]